MMIEIPSLQVHTPDESHAPLPLSVPPVLQSHEIQVVPYVLAIQSHCPLVSQFAEAPFVLATTQLQAIGILANFVHKTFMAFKASFKIEQILTYTIWSIRIPSIIVIPCRTSMAHHTLISGGTI